MRVASLNLRLPQTLRPGEETTVRVDLHGQSDLPKSGRIEIRFDPSQIRLGFTSTSSGVTANVDNGLGQLTIAFTGQGNKSLANEGAALGSLSILAVSRAAAASSFSVQAVDLKDSNGSTVTLAAAAPSIAIKP